MYKIFKYFLRFSPFIVLCLFFLVACSAQNSEDDKSTTAVVLTESPTEIAQENTPTISVVSTATPRPTSTAVPPTHTPPPTTTPDYPIYAGAPLDTAVMGIQIHNHNEDIPALLNHIETMQLGWIKTQVSWKLYQPEQTRYDDVLFAELDELVALADERQIKLLLGVAKAPEWSRPTTEFDGPPTDYNHFASFMTLLATRYAGRVAAYELWNETNLQREWNGAPLNGADLTELIRVGSTAVRAVDPNAQIISGAPAPTGINDGVTAVDDRVYFQQMVNAGLAQWVDGFGIHPYGWANPPASRFGAPDPATSSHNDHPSFFFANTVEDYTAVLQNAGVDTTQKQFWATEFGWGTTDQFGVPPVAGAEFMNQVNEAQQAIYTADAFAIAQANPAMGPMILWNLNFAPTFGTGFSESAYSVLRPDGSPRAVYKTLANR